MRGSTVDCAGDGENESVGYYLAAGEDGATTVGGESVWSAAPIVEARAARGSIHVPASRGDVTCG
jgi:hypothetical protein